MSTTGLVRGGTKAVQRYQQMMNQKYGASLVEDGAWGEKTQAAYEKFVLTKKPAPQKAPDKVNPVSRVAAIPVEAPKAAIRKDFGFNNNNPLFNRKSAAEYAAQSPTKQEPNIGVPFTGFTFPNAGDSFMSRDTADNYLKKSVQAAGSTKPRVISNPGFVKDPFSANSDATQTSMSTITPPTETEFVGTVLDGITGMIDGVKQSTTRAIESVEDLYSMGINWWDRNQAKTNPNLVERNSNIDINKASIEKPIVTGDTLWDDDRRYHIPEIIDLNQTKFGTRNRGQYTPIETPGGVMTTFEPFTPANEYFKENKDAEDSSYIGINSKGEYKAGKKSDFLNSDYKITKTFSNRATAINMENGKIKLVKSNKNASSETLSPEYTTLNPDGSTKNGRMNLLVPRDTQGTKSFDKVTGGRYIFETPDGQKKLVSGSTEDVVNMFNKMKEGNPYVDMYTLDNGAYSRGIRTKDQKLNRDDLRAYDVQNRGGGNFAYLEPEAPRPANIKKFDEFESTAIGLLKKKFPGKTVEVRYENDGLYNEQGGRDYKTQAAIEKAGNSKTNISMHNFDAARDYRLYVNGKMISPDKQKDLYKDVLWGASEKAGLHHVDDWDVAHISLVKEGEGTGFMDLHKQFPELFKNNKTTQETIASLKKAGRQDILDLIYDSAPLIKPVKGRKYKGPEFSNVSMKKSLGGPIDPKNPSKSQKEWKKILSQVQKANGTIGMWGNDISVPTSPGYRMYPTGSMTPEEFAYLQSLKDQGVDKAMKNIVSKPGEVPQFGPESSDMFKQILSKRPKMGPGGVAPMGALSNRFIQEPTFGPFQKKTLSFDGISDKVMDQFTNPTSFTNILGYGADMAQHFDTSRRANQQEQYINDQRMSDNMFSVEDNFRGDYVNTGAAYGQFRPDQMGANSPNGMYGKKYFDLGGVLAPQDVNMEYSEDMAIPASLPALPEMILNSPAVVDFDPASFKDVKVDINKNTKFAFDYYVNKGVPSHVAAGIVGNLHQESGLSPTAKETTNTANGRGIAQWDKRDRWPAFQNWAKQNGLKSNDLTTQLEYVLEEAKSRGDLQKTLSARNAEEAAIIFGRSFERPSEKHANWNKRTSVARKLASQTFEEGGEYDMDEEQLKQFLAMGGEVEYID